MTDSRFLIYLSEEDLPYCLSRALCTGLYFFRHSFSKDEIEDTVQDSVLKLLMGTRTIPHKQYLSKEAFAYSLGLVVCSELSNRLKKRKAKKAIVHYSMDASNRDADDPSFSKRELSWEEDFTLDLIQKEHFSALKKEIEKTLENDPLLEDFFNSYQYHLNDNATNQMVANHLGTTVQEVANLKRKLRRRLNHLRHLVH